MSQSFCYCVFMRNPKSCLLSISLFSGFLSACKKYVAQAIAKGQDRERLAIVPMYFFGTFSCVEGTLFEEADHVE